MGPWRRAPFCRFASGINTRELVLVWLLLAGVAGVLVVVGREQTLEAQLAKLDSRLTMPHNRWEGTIFGYPPVPPRPNHPKRVSATYYRGNCERNKELFNGGNYLTATFRVALCDASRHPLEVGDAVSDSLLVRIEIERAPARLKPSSPRG